MRTSIQRSVSFALSAVLVSASGCTSNPGYLKVSSPDVEVQLRAGWGRTVKITQASGAVALSSGTYTPRAIRLTAKDPASQDSSRPKDVTWTLTSQGPFENLQIIDVQPGKTTVLEAGPPLALKVYTRERDQCVNVSFDILGRAGEVYPGAASRNGQAQPLPTVKILDASGKVLQSGSFAFG